MRSLLLVVVSCCLRLCVVVGAVLFVDAAYKLLCVGCGVCGVLLELFVGVVVCSVLSFVGVCLVAYCCCALALCVDCCCSVLLLLCAAVKY